MRNADEKSQTAEEGITVSNRFFLFLILGFVLVFVGIIVVLVTAVLYGAARRILAGLFSLGRFR